MLFKEIRASPYLWVFKIHVAPFDPAINLVCISQKWFIIERYHFFWRFETRSSPQSLIQHFQDSKPDLYG